MGPRRGTRHRARRGGPGLDESCWSGHDTLSETPIVGLTYGAGAFWEDILSGLYILCGMRVLGIILDEIGEELLESLGLGFALTGKLGIGGVVALRRLLGLATG